MRNRRRRPCNRACDRRPPPPGSSAQRAGHRAVHRGRYRRRRRCSVRSTAERERARETGLGRPVVRDELFECLRVRRLRGGTRTVCVRLERDQGFIAMSSRMRQPIIDIRARCGVVNVPLVRFLSHHVPTDVRVTELRAALHVHVEELGGEPVVEPDVQRLRTGRVGDPARTVDVASHVSVTVIFDGVVANNA
jgi:hypothetical protein